ncbi:MAG TPA: tRNA lysidine(34) synthetase TilS [Myxococcota bacterium]|nr:tRNA lysidine(34) synthetase TilS [Myxococcota bacterium]
MSAAGAPRRARAPVLRAAEGALRAAGAAPGTAASTILVAVSGGVDSVVLLDVLCRLARPLGLRLHVGHVNHRLRAEESDADQRFVEELARKRGLSVAVRAVEPLSARRFGPSRTRPSLEEAARILRHAALRELALEAGAGLVATAHHADDQAETVLLRLFRGTGPDGLGGIAERSRDGLLVRPLLSVSRGEIEAYARATGLSWCEDGSNANRAFTRNRLRLGWLPGLATEFNPRLLQRIADLAEAQRRDSEWIAALVADEAARRIHKEGDVVWLVREGWQALPEGLARRLARHALAESGASRDVSRAHLERMLAFLRRPRRGARIELPGGRTLRCEAQGFRLDPRAVRGEPAC